ncbi:MAG TPA: DUF6596 domain-containing protein [Streptosporangiaceae bacterium]|nr:DUF6596 domain-containing protein [Streptosporangiaceae bacterium]
MSVSPDEIAGHFRREYGRCVATLIRFFDDIDIAEEAVQEAFAVAVSRWPETGLPPNPGAWITTTARNRAIDHLRREASRHDRHARAALLYGQDDPPEQAGPVTDDRLRLIFTCCHPALARTAQVALTLRLVFNEGHTATDGDALLRLNLCDEAVRLARVLAELMPDEPEVLGLLALLLLTHSRTPARTAPGQPLVLLPDQDRSRWDRALIEEGQALVRRRLRRNQPGPYQIQAAIAAVHSDAPTAAQTDWRQILALYKQLTACAPTAVVALNRAVALAEVDGAEAALAATDRLDLGSYYLFHATRASLLRRLGRSAEAARAYEAARALTTNEAERAFLERQRNALPSPR